ncbi:MAG: tRNA 2-thiouridine(34) synthase MnmA [Acidimicrobiales bacterium]
MKVLVAMSGGVDSSVAAVLLARAGHDVTGVTLKLWGGDSDSGCCSVSDVDDARRAADHLGLEHHVFNFGQDFDEHVVDPYVRAHQDGLTPNPCVECNRHLKFERLTTRAAQLGFDAVATGHHAVVEHDRDGRAWIGRGADPAKDQSYVLHMLTGRQLDGLLLPIGAMTKTAVRAVAEEAGLRIAAKPDSQDVCFITRTEGRRRFLEQRIDLHPGTVVDQTGHQVGTVDAVEMVTIGQRRGLGVSGTHDPRFAVDVDVRERRVVIGPKSDLLVSRTAVTDLGWAHDPVEGAVLVQTSAHGDPTAASIAPGDGNDVVVSWSRARQRVAPGQSVVFYDGTRVLGGGIAGFGGGIAG